MRKPPIAPGVFVVFVADVSSALTLWAVIKLSSVLVTNNAEPWETKIQLMANNAKLRRLIDVLICQQLVKLNKGAGNY